LRAEKEPGRWKEIYWKRPEKLRKKLQKLLSGNIKTSTSSCRAYNPNLKPLTKRIMFSFLMAPSAKEMELGVYYF
jgi:hypothetical protein